MHTIYEAHCHECGDLSVMPAEEDTHMGIAKKHHESTGHTCEVLQETKSVVFHGRKPEIVSHADIEVIAIFD